MDDRVITISALAVLAIIVTACLYVCIPCRERIHLRDIERHLDIRESELKYLQKSGVRIV